MEIQWKSLKILENQWQTVKIQEIPWNSKKKSLKIHAMTKFQENLQKDPRKSLKIQCRSVEIDEKHKVVCYVFARIGCKMKEKSVKIDEKAMKSVEIDEKHKVFVMCLLESAAKSSKINENRWKSNENLWRSMKKQWKND